MTSSEPLFRTQRRVEFSQTDMAGIVHFSNFYKWMEEVEHAYFRSLGLSIMLRQDDGSYIGWPRVNAQCRFEAPARYDDMIEARLWIERIGFKSLSFEIEFWRDSTRLAIGKMKSACCICGPEGSLQSIEIPELYREKLTERPRRKED